MPMIPGLPALASMVGGHGTPDRMFTSADVEAREAMRRCCDESLKARVAEFTRGLAPLPMRNRPTFLLIRAIPSWDHETLRFLALCEAVGAEPLLVTMRGDRFTSVNPDKYRRARMTFWWGQRTRVLRAADMRCADGRPMTSLRTRRGHALSEFHEAFLAAHTEVPVMDMTDWLRPGGRSDYCHFFALCMVGAVLVEAVDPDPLEQAFMHERMLPGWERACSLFGARPLMTCHLTPAENHDGFWWGYPGDAFVTAADLLYQGR